MNSVPLSLYTWLGMPYLRGCDDNTPLYNIISLASKKSLDRAKMILSLLGFIHLIAWLGDWSIQGFTDGNMGDDKYKIQYLSKESDILLLVTL